MKLKKIVTFLLLTISTCTLALENASNERQATNKTVVPIHLIYHSDSLETDNGLLADYLTNFANMHNYYGYCMPKIIIMNSVIAYALLADMYQRFVNFGYQMPTQKTPSTNILYSARLNQSKGWGSVPYGTNFFLIADFYLTVAKGEKFLIAVYNPQNKYFQSEELLNANHVRKIRFPSQPNVIFDEEQTQLAEELKQLTEIMDEIHESIALSEEDRLATMADNFVRIFNQATSYALRFFVSGHGMTLYVNELEENHFCATAGMPGKNIAQLLTALNTLPTTNLVLFQSCHTGGFNAKLIADFLERKCPNRNFSVATYPATDRRGDGPSVRTGDIYQPDPKLPLPEALSSSYGTVAYLAATAKKFKILTKDKEALHYELAKTATISEEYGVNDLTQASFDLIQDYEKEHNCEVISYLACETAKNNNSALFVQIFRSFPNRLDPKLFITCLRLLAEHGNLTDVTFLLKNYPNPIDQEQRKSILELAKRNTTPK